MKPRDGLRLQEDEHVGKGLEAFIVADMTGRPTTTGTEPDSGGILRGAEIVRRPPGKSSISPEIANKVYRRLILHSSRLLVDKAAPRERRDGRLNRLDLTGTDSHGGLQRYCGSQL